MAIPPIESVLRKRVGTYLALAETIHLNQSEKLIHDFRVASRELIALEPILLYAGAKKKIFKKLKKWLSAFSALRDIQVLQLRFAEHSRLSHLLQQQFSQELANLENTLQKIAQAKFQAKLRLALEQAVELGNQDRIRFNQAMLQDWQHGVAQLRAALSQLNEAEPRSLHKVRIRFKNVRYIAQFLMQSHMVNLKLKKQDLKYWQDQLGAIQDLTMAINWLENQPKTKGQVTQLQRELKQNCRRFIAESADFLHLIERMDSKITQTLNALPT